jgi:hypothetical protein
VTTDPDPSKAAIAVTTDSGRSTSGNPGPPTDPELSASACEPYRELVELGLRRGRNAIAIWQDLISDHGFAGSYQTVKRFVRNLRGPQGPEAAGIVSPQPEKKRRSTTAVVRWWAIRRTASIARRGYSC